MAVSKIPIFPHHPIQQINICTHYTEVNFNHKICDTDTFYRIYKYFKKTLHIQKRSRTNYKTKTQNAFPQKPKTPNAKNRPEINMAASFELVASYDHKATNLFPKWQHMVFSYIHTYSYTYTHIYMYIYHGYATRRGHGR